MLFRLAAGSIERSSAVPVMLAPGVYVARNIRRGPSGSGWSLVASYAYATIRNTNKLADGGSPTTSRFMIGLGWYQ